MEQRRQQVGQRFSGSCAGLDDDMVLFFQCPMNGFGHPDLGRTEFVVLETLFQNSARPEEIAHHDGDLSPSGPD